MSVGSITPSKLSYDDSVVPVFYPVVHMQYSPSQWSKRTAMMSYVRSYI